MDTQLRAKRRIYKLVSLVKTWFISAISDLIKLNLREISLLLFENKYINPLNSARLLINFKAFLDQVHSRFSVSVCSVYG